MRATKLSGKLAQHLDVGALIATVLAVCTTLIWNSPSLNAEIVVLLSALIAAAYYGLKGSLLIICIYTIPVSTLLVRTAVHPLDWLIFASKVLFILACSYIAARISTRVWRQVRKSRSQLALLRRELRRFRRLQLASEEIAQQIGLPDVMDHTLSSTVELLNSKAAGVWFNVNGLLELQHSIDWPTKIDSKQFLAHWELNNGYFYHEGYNVLFSRLDMASGHEGVLAVAFAGRQKRYRAALRSLVVLARSASAALTKTRVLEAHRKQADYLGLLNDLGHKFASNLGLEDLFSSMYQEVRRVMDAEAFFVALYDAKNEEIDLRYIFDEGKRVDPFKYKLNDGPTARAIKTRLPISHHIDARLVPGVTVIGNDARIVQSLLVVPIIRQDKILGALSAQSYSHNAYTQEHIRILSIIANQSAIAIENAQLYEQTLQMALTDSMTGLANARALHQSLDAAIKRAESHPTEISLIMIDSDSLKHINDRFGHLAGDEHIYILSEIIRENVRVGDVVARYAGDEFVVLLPNTNSVEAKIIAHRIVQAVRVKDCKFGSQTVRVTASAGVATYPRDANTAEELIRAADMAMYRAKSAGKDQVATSSESNKVAGA